MMLVRDIHSATEILEGMLAAERRRARLFEWVMTAAMFGVALILILSPESILLGTMHLMRQVGLTGPVVVAMFGLAGAFRSFGLYANGSSRVYGPRLRSAGAAIGSVVWGQIFVAQVGEFLSGSMAHLPIGVAIYGCITVGELFACYRAARDVRC